MTAPAISNTTVGKTAKAVRGFSLINFSMISAYQPLNFELQTRNNYETHTVPTQNKNNSSKEEFKRTYHDTLIGLSSS